MASKKSIPYFADLISTYEHKWDSGFKKARNLGMGKSPRIGVHVTLVAPRHRAEVSHFAHWSSLSSVWKTNIRAL